ncbi:MAG: 50S ribosomal protein L21e [Candidatus Aenigmarchaeota archaeon]|nr:50S ribosomal protein L21e [Candidatus Aenigmarchaeota archaeon]
MVQKSSGPRKRSRSKMRTKRRATPSDFLKEFHIGDKVCIKLQPNLKNKGYPYIKFHGASGEIVKRMGNAYVVKFLDKNAEKQAILNPVHLKKL